MFSSRDAAVDKYRAANSTKFNTKFESEPTTRPSYVPQSTKVNGNDYPVTYNQQYGGYGYNGPSGWNSYNPLMDMMILSALMDNDGYVVVQQPAAPAAPVPATAPTVPAAASTVAQAEDDGSSWTFPIIIFVCVFAVAGFLIFNSSSKGGRI